MAKNKNRDRNRNDYDDEWGEKQRPNRKRYDKVKAAIKRARKNKKRQREMSFYGE